MSPALYDEPFITERDEPVWNDCAVCSVLMGGCFGTLGAIVRKPDGSYMTRAEMKVLRERIRKRTGDAQGGVSLVDVCAAIEEEWPSIEAPVTRRTSDQIWKLITTSHVAAIQGNPSRVRDVNSPLRRWTRNDDFGHAIRIGQGYTDPKGVRWCRVKDPLGFGSYTGQPVRWSEIEQFMSFYRKAGGYHYVSVWKEGDALSTSSVITPFEAPRGLTVEGGNTRKNGYRHNPKTLRYELAKSVVFEKATRLTAAATAVLSQQPRPQDVPSGTCYLVANTPGNGQLAGLYISAAGTKLDAAPAAPKPDCTDQVAAARAAGERAGAKALADKIRPHLPA